MGAICVGADLKPGETRPLLQCKPAEQATDSVSQTGSFSKELRQMAKDGSSGALTKEAMHRSGLSRKQPSPWEEIVRGHARFDAMENATDGS